MINSRTTSFSEEFYQKFLSIKAGKIVPNIFDVMKKWHKW